MSEVVSHIRFPLRVFKNGTHVYILDAGDRAFATVAYSKRVPFSYEYAKLVCTAQARALTDVFERRMPDMPVPPAEDAPEDLAYKVELWFDDDNDVQQVLARFAKPTHAQLYFDTIRPEYHGRILRVRQGIRVIWETAGSSKAP